MCSATAPTACATRLPSTRVFDEGVALANTIFIPSSLLVFVFGIWLTIEGPWSFGDLWIVLGLVGYR